MKNLPFALLGLLLIGCAASSGGASDNPDYDFNKRAIEVLKPKCESGNYSACNDLAISYQNLQDHKNTTKGHAKITIKPVAQISPICIKRASARKKTKTKPSRYTRTRARTAGRIRAIIWANFTARITTAKSPTT